MRRRLQTLACALGVALVAGAVFIPGGAPASATGSHNVNPAPALQSVGEATSTFQFHVSVTPVPEAGAASHGVAVDFSIGSASTATCGTDYSVTGISSVGPGSSFVGACGPPPPHGTLVFGPGDGDETVNFSIANDTSNEGAESIFVNLFDARCINSVGGGCPSTVHPNPTDPSPVRTGELRIVDNDAATFTVADASANEGDAVRFNVTLSPPPALNQTASVTCEHDTSFTGTATPTTDFDATSRTLTFNPGDSTLPCSFPTVEDATEEPNETFRIKLTGAAGTGGYATNPTATDTADGTIINDDGASAVVSKASVADASANEGEAVVFTVTVSVACATGTSASIPFDTRNAGGTSTGSATEGTDYQRTQGTVAFTGTETSKTISVTTVEDTTNESDETFSVFLGTPTGTCGATNADTEGVGTIKNDDGTTGTPTPNVQIRIANKQVKEGDSLTRPCFLAVTLSAAATQSVTVKYATADGTATEDEDYALNSGTLTFAPGVTAQRVEITVFGDTVNDQGRRETVLVNLTSPTGATIADNQGKCKIYEGRRP
jgi:hypothetical protein